MLNKKILVIDGGGGKGIITTALLKELEKELGKPLYEVFDLIVGTSVGGIIGGILSSGILKAEELHYIMMDAMPQIFSKRIFTIPILMAKYNRNKFDELFNKIIGQDFLMSDCITKFVCTAVNKIDGKTHFFKNWEEKDGKMKLLDAIKRTSAAPYYFNHIRENGNVWLDGGTGDVKCPLCEAIIDIMRMGWLKDNVHVLSLGTGYSDKSLSYLEAIKFGVLGDVLCYMDPLDGGLSRNQSIMARIKFASTFSDQFDNFSFQRIDKEIDKNLDGMDKMEHIEEYEKIGNSLIKDINLELLM